MKQFRNVCLIAVLILLFNTFFTTATRAGTSDREVIYDRGGEENDAKKYALLITPVSPAHGGEAHRSDLFCLMNLLKTKGWEDENIIMLTKYFGCDYSDQFIDGDANKQNVLDVLNGFHEGGQYWIEDSNQQPHLIDFDDKIMDSNDTLFISFKGHGVAIKETMLPFDELDGYDGAWGTYTNTNKELLMSSCIKDDVVRNKLNNLDYYHIIMEVVACGAGEFDECQGTNRILCLSSDEGVTSEGIPPFFDIFDGFVAEFASAPYSNVSVEDAFWYESDTIPSSSVMNPVLIDGIIGETYLD